MSDDQSAPAGRRFPGTITVPSFDLPLSAALSKQAAALQAAAYSNPGAIGMPDLDRAESEDAYRAMVDMFRNGIDQMFAIPLEERVSRQFPVNIERATIAGIPVEIFTPEEHHDPNRVIINLHGGGFYSGSTHIARIESIPVASIGKFRVISVDYRQGYEHKFPAATDDVAAVFTDLLQTFAAERIGLYGGSAGGLLTLQTTARLVSRGLPPPGAIGIFCSGAGGNGDGDYFSAIGTAQSPPIDAFRVRGKKFGYFSNAAHDDPMINPVLGGTALLAKFPPSLFLTGTRAFDLSPAIATHRALCQAEADTDLHVFDGHGHCFYYDTALPESFDAYNVIARFFRTHLGG
jgi:monoterpene epsilon-lactone hydrolase